MALKSNKKIILAKIETVYGTDAVPTGAANSVLIMNPKITPLEIAYDDRNSVRPFFGNFQQVAASAYVMLEFDVEMAGSGAAGTVPAWDALMQGCGFSSTVTATVKVDYAPISGAEKSLSIYYNVDGVLHKLLGAKGTVQLDFQKGKIPLFKFKFWGLNGGATDTAAPAAVFTAFQTPLAMNNVNTTGFALHGFAGVMETLNIDIAAQQVYRNLVGSESIQFVDRKAAGQISMEAPTIAAVTPDFFTRARAATLGAFALTHGTAGGNKIVVTSATAQVTKPQYASSDNIEMLQLGLLFVPSTAGNDEILISAQ